MFYWGFSLLQKKRCFSSQKRQNVGGHFLVRLTAETRAGGTYRAAAGAAGAPRRAQTHNDGATRPSEPAAVFNGFPAQRDSPKKNGLRFLIPLYKCRSSVKPLSVSPSLPPLSSRMNGERQKLQVSSHNTEWVTPFLRLVFPILDVCCACIVDVKWWRM